jgi:hypothetical protein
VHELAASARHPDHFRSAERGAVKVDRGGVAVDDE